MNKRVDSLKYQQNRHLNQLKDIEIISKFIISEMKKRGHRIRYKG